MSALPPIIRDICPVHGVPMWYWRVEGTYACQRPECTATKPVTQIEFAVTAQTAAMASLREAMLRTPPTLFGGARNPFKVTTTT